MTDRKYELVDMDRIPRELQQKIARDMFSFKPAPAYLFGGKMVFSVCGNHTLDATENRIILACLEDLVKKLTAYYDYSGKTI